jgi:dihydroorotate dehydrogenase
MVAISRLIIGAPFGNYLNWANCTPTLGTFTRNYRGGVLWRLWRCLLTLRPHPRLRAWSNRLGLPNPGLNWLGEQVISQRINLTGKIVSISARCDNDWYALLYGTQVLAGMPGGCPAAVELNVSCPNCGDTDTTDYVNIFTGAVRYLQETSGIAVIVKLPPVSYRDLAAKANYFGCRGVHCCNTLPTPAGGLSGKPLQPLSLEAVRYCRSLNQSWTIIGGGGIVGPEDVARFTEAGADHFAVASALLNPFNWPAIQRTATWLSQK